MFVPTVDSSAVILMGPCRGADKNKIMMGLMKKNKQASFSIQENVYMPLNYQMKTEAANCLMSNCTLESLEVQKKEDNKR